MLVWAPDFAMGGPLIPLTTIANRVDTLFADSAQSTTASIQGAARLPRKPATVSNPTNEPPTKKPEAGKLSFLGSLWNRLGFGD